MPLPTTINDVAVRVPRRYRNQAITASTVAAVIGKHPYLSPFTLYHRLAGNIAAPAWNAGTARMEAGRELESYVIRKWRRANPGRRAVRVPTFASIDRPWQVATPDAVVEDKTVDGCIYATTGIEAKTDEGSDGWGEPGTDEIPDYIRAQGLTQIDVCGFEVVDVPVMFSFTDFRVFRIERDWSDIKYLRREAWAFLERVQSGAPPPLDWLNSTAATVRALYPDVDDVAITVDHDIAGRYTAAVRNLRAAKDAKDLAENELRLAMGTARWAWIEYPDGKRDKVATRSKYEVAAHTRRTSTVDKLIPPKNLES